jgi:glycosyltransferase involved in cell wall biosynthesis
MASRIAFYAPMKPPDHMIASGDREIARLMVGALQTAGFEVDIVSSFISYQKHPDGQVFHALRDRGLAEAERVVAEVRSGHRTRPDLWLTYHPYCKAPDWIGPHVARALSIPYATVEACRTRQGSDADWRDGRQAVEDAIRLAAVNFCLKPSDNAYLRTVLPDMTNVVALEPFVDVEAIHANASPIDIGSCLDPHAPLIIAVGMMRPGVKVRSYALLAKSLSGLTDRPWNLVVVGDGPERANVESMFAFAEERACFTGALRHADVLGWMKEADLLAWPGVGEAIGMVYLEAGACGLPVAACDVANVATVVADGKSGLLAPEAEAPAYRAVLNRLLGDGELRERLGKAGSGKVAREHGIASAAATLKAAIEPLLQRSTAPAELAG